MNKSSLNLISFVYEQKRGTAGLNKCKYYSNAFNQTFVYGQLRKSLNVVWSLQFQNTCRI